MFSKNLKYYRLKKNLSKTALASMADVTPAAISNYENGTRKPDIEIIKRLANALDVKVSDFLNNRNTNLVFAHEEFRKGSSLTVAGQEYIRESVEEYMSRFFTVVDILGGEVLPEPPNCHSLELSDDVETCALAMREALHISDRGPIGNLVELLENIGILVFYLEIDSEKYRDAFSGMNGRVNERPYVVISSTMSPERSRSTISHELAHIIFSWPQDMNEKEIEDKATAISGAFLFPRQDALRELGPHRSRVSKDMTLVCKEYGISMYLLVKRATLCGIISDNEAKNFYIQANQHGWKKKEPHRIEQEQPTLFSQLVFRAVSEGEISIQKGAELLKIPYSDVERQCFMEIA